MRHRYRVDLYDDVELEARLVDLVESMPRSRRQEFLRTMIKVGFLNTYGNSNDQLKKPSELPSENPKKVGDKKEVRPKHHPEKISSGNTPLKPSVPIKEDDFPRNSSEETSDYELNSSSKKERFIIPSTNSNKDVSHEGDIKIDGVTNDEDDVVDSLDEFNGLFDGLNDGL